MDSVELIHGEDAYRDWSMRSITYQMGNIGSEVSRSLKWSAKGNQARADKAIDRALELFDFTIEANKMVVVNEHDIFFLTILRVGGRINIMIMLIWNYT